MIRSRFVRLTVVALLLVACASPLRPLGGLTDPEVRITLLQVNDVYTLEPVDEGRRGGLARLATLVARLRRENPTTLLALAGDVISPSVASTVLKGEQMIAGLNAVGFDLATFGNHEFDFGPAVLTQRLRESKFTWLSANVLDRRSGRPFGGAEPDVFLTLGGVGIGLFGLTTPQTLKTSNPGPEVEIREAIGAARVASAQLKARGAQLLVAISRRSRRAAGRDFSSGPGATRRSSRTAPGSSVSTSTGRPRADARTPGRRWL